MAKNVQDVLIKVGLKTDASLDALKGKFKALNTAIQLTDTEIGALRSQLKGFTNAQNQSEAALKAGIASLKQLRSQVSINSASYKALSSDIDIYKARLDGSSVAIQKQRRAILEQASALKTAGRQGYEYIDQLEKLREKTREGSKATVDFSNDIDKLKAKMAELKAEERKAFGEGAKGAFAGLINGGQKATGAVDAVIKRFARLGREAKTASGAWNRILEGIGALGVGASAAGPALSGLQIGTAANAAKLNFQQGLAGLLGKIPGPIGGYMQERSAELQSALADAHKFESVLQGLHSATDGILSALGQIGPEAAAATAIGGAAFAGLFDLIKQHTNETEGELTGAVARIRNIFESMSMELPKLLREYRRLSSDQIGGLLSDARGEFALRPAGSARSRALASQIAGLENVGAQEAARQADVLEQYRQRVRGTREDAQALGDRLAYVQGKLKTLDQTTEEGRAEFAQYSNEAISLTDKLQKLGDGYRHVSTMATQAATAQQNAANAGTRLSYLNFRLAQSQRQAMTELRERVTAGVTGTPLLLPAAGQTSAPGTGAAISGGARRSLVEGVDKQGNPVFRPGVETTFDEPNFRKARTRGIRAGYYNPRTADVGQPAAVGRSVAEQGQAARKTGADLLQYTAAISKARQANTGSIESINKLRQALVDKRNVIPATSAGFARLTREIEALDRQSAKYALNQKKRGFGRNVRAGVGAALSGAVFGGPEAAIGGLVGGLAGGIAGGAAGAGLGAQASMLRQSLAGTAEYAAQLEKMRIALKGVAGSQEDYSKALSIADGVTSRFNVAQGDSITGMTRLAAAVTGAGGKVYDAGLVFENITAAIKATGGSTEDVNSAITAMVQVFSKGKVSAEELSGQLGERLPGAVTLFAEANKMSLVELQKALKAGTVGLDQLMKFVIELGDKYGETADDISKSGAEAGARLKVIIDDLRAEIGKALQPVGEELQDTFGKFIAENKDNIVAFAKSTAQAFQTLLEILKKYGPVIVAILKFAAVTAVLRTLSPVITGIGVGFKVTAAAMGLFNKTSFATLRQMALLKKAAIGLRAVAGNIVFAVSLIGFDIVFSQLNKLKKARNDLETLKGQSRGADFVKEIGGSALTKAQIKPVMENANRTTEIARQNLINYRKELQQRGGQELPAGASYDPKKLLTGTRNDQLAALIRKEEERLNVAASRYRALVEAYEVAPTEKPSDFADPTGGDDEKGGKGKLLMTQQELLLRRQIREAALKENDLAKAVATYRLDVLEANKETKDLVAKQNMLEEANLKFQQSLLEYKTKQVEKAEELRRINADITYDFKQRQYELGLISKEQMVQSELAREEQRLREQLKDEDPAKAKAIIEKGKDLKRRELDPTFKEAAETDLVLMERQLESMLDPLNQLKGAAEAFGSSLTNAFNSVITGQASVKQALAGFLKDLGQYFLEYTAKVITQMIVIATVQAAIKALGGPSLGGGGGAGSAGTPGTPDVSGFGSYDISNTPTLASFGNAQGNAFNKGLKRYAMGGVVNKPTMFTYAEGGVGRYGLMGEAGAEAIIPLKRGNDGRLGVSLFADTNAAVKAKADKSREAAFTENNEALAESSSYMRERTIEREQQTMLTGAGGTALVQTQVINSVEYATVDQLNAAAAQSAKKARAEVFAEMRNKPSVRKSLGMR